MQQAHSPLTAGIAEAIEAAKKLQQVGADQVADIEQIDAAFNERLKTDFFFLVNQLWTWWRYINFHPLTDIDEDLCNWVSSGPRKRGVLAPRKFGKTHIVGAYAIFRLLQNPDAKILIVSKSLGGAKDTIHMLQDWILQTPFLQHLAPTSKRARWTSEYFDVGGAQHNPRTPSVSACGIDGQITGRRADVVIGDDVETPENTKTRASRIDLAESVKEFANVIYDDGEIIYVGTYHHRESLYLVLPGRGYTFRTWPLQYPNEQDRLMNLSPLLIARLQSGGAKPGDIVFNVRWGQAYIEEKQAEGRLTYAQQYMLIANLDDETLYPLKLKDLIVPTFAIDRDTAPLRIHWGTENANGPTMAHDIPIYDALGTDSFYHQVMLDTDAWHPFTTTIMWVDTSGRGKDKTAWAIISHLNSYLWIHKVCGMNGGHNEAVKSAICQDARDYRVRTIYVEAEFGGDMFADLLQPHIKEYFIEPGTTEECPRGWKCAIEPEPTWTRTGFKEARIINCLGPLTQSHKVVIDRTVAANADFQQQYTSIMKERGALEHDDELEAIAAGCWKLKDLVGIDPQRNAERSKEQRLKEMVNEFLRELGVKPKLPCWFRHLHDN